MDAEMYKERQQKLNVMKTICQIKTNTQKSSVFNMQEKRNMSVQSTTLQSTLNRPVHPDMQMKAFIQSVSHLSWNMTSRF